MSPLPALIVLGPSGTGKSTAGVLLSARTGKRLIDTDAAFESRLGEALFAAFRTMGAAQFRKAYYQFFVEQSQCVFQSDTIVVVGGAAPLYAPTRDLLARVSATKVTLLARPDSVVSRLRADPQNTPHNAHPLLRSADPVRTISSLYAYRMPFYLIQDSQEYWTDSKSAQEVAKDLMALWYAHA